MTRNVKFGAKVSILRHSVGVTKPMRIAERPGRTARQSADAESGSWQLILTFAGVNPLVLMVLNYIWVAFFLVAFVIAVVRLVVLGDTEVFPAIINSTFDSAKTAFEISLGLTGVLALWMGVMKVGERGGVVQALARVLSPVFVKLFPEIPKGHPVVGNIFMNIAANMLGLDNAATPMGLKAMEGLQELNPKKDTASNAMIMFLVLNTSGLTIIPVSIMVYRAQLGAAIFGDEDTRQ